MRELAPAKIDEFLFAEILGGEFLLLRKGAVCLGFHSVRLFVIAFHCQGLILCKLIQKFF